MTLLLLVSYRKRIENQTFGGWTLGGSGSGTSSSDGSGVYGRITGSGGGVLIGVSTSCLDIRGGEGDLLSVSLLAMISSDSAMFQREIFPHIM